MAGCTCKSWGQSAQSSVCQIGRRHHHLRHPRHRFRLSHTGRCCLTAAGKAERGNDQQRVNERLKYVYCFVLFFLNLKSEAKIQFDSFTLLLWPQNSPTCSALGE